MECKECERNGCRMDKIDIRKRKRVQQKKSSIMLVISMVIFGTIGFFTRKIAVASSELALYRAVLAMAMVGGYLLIRGQSIEIRSIKKDIPALMCSGVAMGINWILLFEAYRYTTISTATVSYYFAPVIVMVACCFIFHEKLSKEKILCFIMSAIGLILTMGIQNLRGGGNDIKGVLFGLSAAVFYAIVILLNKAIKNVAGLERTLFQFAACIVVLGPYVLLTNGITLYQLDTVGWAYLLIVGIIHTGIAYCLYFSALKDLPGQETAILSYIDPLVAVLLSVFILGESITMLQVLGAALILGFTLWNELRS